MTRLSLRLHHDEVFHPVGTKYNNSRVLVVSVNECVAIAMDTI